MSRSLHTEFRDSIIGRQAYVDQAMQANDAITEEEMRRSLPSARWND